MKDVVGAGSIECGLFSETTYALTNGVQPWSRCKHSVGCCYSKIKPFHSNNDTSSSRSFCLAKRYESRRKSVRRM